MQWSEQSLEARYEIKFRVDVDWTSQLFVTLSIVQTLLHVTFVCSPSWKKTPGESRFEDSEKVKSAVTFDDFHEAFTK